MLTRSGRSLTWAFTVVTALLLGASEGGLLRIRLLAPAAAAVFGLSFLLARSAAARQQRVRIAAMVIAGTAAVGGIGTVLGDPLYKWLPSAATLLLGGAWLLVWLDSEAGVDEGNPGRGTWTAVIVLLAVVLLGGEVAFTTSHARLVDEMWYLLQGDLLAHGDPVGRYPAGQEALHAISLGWFSGGRFVGQYPMGWPTLLALPMQWNLERFVGPLMALLAAVGTGALAQREAGPRAGILAALCVGLSPVLAPTSWTYLSHTASTAFVVGAALALEIGLASTGTRAAVALWLCGLSGGALFAVRPLTAIVLGAIVAIRAFWPARHGITRTLLASRSALILGFALPTALVFFGNQVMNGSWHRFGYSLVHGTLNQLGFGQRGYLNWGASGKIEPEIVTFTPVMGLEFTVVGALALLITFLPIGITLPLLAIRPRPPLTPPLRWWVAGIVLVVAVYSLWFYRGTRFYYDVLPLFAASTVILLLQHDLLRARWRTVAFQIGLVGLCIIVGRGIVAHTWSRGVDATYGRVAALAPPGQRIVLAVDPRSDGGAALLSLYALNGPRFGGRYTVIRDRGLRADSLAVLFPGTIPFRVTCGPCSDQGLALMPQTIIERVMR